MPLTTNIPADEILDFMINSSADIQRSKLVTEQLKFNIHIEDVRVWDAFQTSLPTTAAADDLAMIPGTWATDAITIQTSDSKNTTVTQRARFLFRVPENYVAGQAISIVSWAGMRTTVASSSATIDFEVYKKNDATGGAGSDLVTTAATTINSLTAAPQAFVITPTGITSGDELDCRVTISITDVGTATAVIGRIMKLYFLCSVKG